MNAMLLTFRIIFMAALPKNETHGPGCGEV
jgi:hypothetical protein